MVGQDEGKLMRYSRIGNGVNPPSSLNVGSFSARIDVAAKMDRFFEAELSITKISTAEQLRESGSKQQM